ncbi:MAG: NRDE family protein [Pseudomonadota bacterium]
MCLILLAWQKHPDFPLIVAANRDEFHARPAARAAFWQDRPAILAGRDLEAGGTWMGVSRGGRFAAVTNYRGGREPRAVESRGALVTGFLLSDLNPEDFVTKTETLKGSYSGFNLLVADGSELWWLSNRDSAPRRLEPGIYGLGNLLLDDPEVAESKARFLQALDLGVAIEPLFGVLAPARIVAPEYGTRCSTILLRGIDGRVQFAERGFDADGGEGPTGRYEFRPGP